MKPPGPIAITMEPSREKGKNQFFIQIFEFYFVLVSSVAVKRRKKFFGCSLLEHFELGQKVGVGTFG